MSALQLRTKHVRRAGIFALILTAIAVPLALGASAWQGAQWNTGLRWSDGQEVHWRATRALGCDGSNVELRLVNNATSSGELGLKDITLVGGSAGSRISLMAGIRMLQRRSYGLVMTGVIIGMVPCLSACCCTGLPFGIWALVVLSNEEVRKSFH